MNKNYTPSALAIICLLLIFSCRHDSLSGFIDIPETLPPILKPHYENVNEIIAGYYSAVPARYNYNGNEKKYPLLICFHGAGGHGNGGEEDLKSVLVGVAGLLRKENRFPPSFHSNGQYYSFILMAPQFKQYPTNDHIRSFIQYVKLNFRIDETRIYLVGLSSGGRMSSDYASAYSNEIAAVVTMGGCSVGEPSFTLNDKCKNLASSNVGVWAFHNKDDLAWPSRDSQRFISAINSFSNITTPRLTIFNESVGTLNHDCWNRASNPNYKEENKNIYEWLLTFKK